MNHRRHLSLSVMLMALAARSRACLLEKGTCVWTRDGMAHDAGAEQRTTRIFNVYGHYFVISMHLHSSGAVKVQNRPDLAITIRNMQVHPYRSFVLMLFRNGQLSSLGEGVMVAGVSKPTLQRWLVEDGIDWQATRLAQLNRYHTKSEHRAIAAIGRKVKRRPRKRFTKKELLRIRGDKAIAQRK